MLELINKISKGLKKMLFDYAMDLIGATNSDRWAHVVGFMPLAAFLTFIFAGAISSIIGLSTTFIINKLKKGKIDFISCYIKISLFLFPIVFILSFFTSNGKVEDSVWETTPGSETVLVPNDKKIKLSIVEVKDEKIVVQFGDSETDKKEYYLDPDSKVEKTETVEEPSVTSAVVSEKKLVHYYRGKGYYTLAKPREFLKIDGKIKLKDSEKILNSNWNRGRDNDF